MNKKTLTFLVFLCTYFHSYLKSQITVSPNTGLCSPQSVNFSGPAGATNVFWNIGGTVGTTTVSNPSNLYNSPGTYNITYTALVGGSPVNYATSIVVNAGPPASFNAVIPSSHCAPMNVLFTCSTNNPNNPVSWYFGDLSPIVSNTQTTSHTYVSQGVFVPVVIVTNASNGCTTIATASGNGTILVSALPNVQILSGSGNFGCSSPFSSFMTGSLSAANSPIPGPLTSYNWSFGGGNPSSSGNVTPGNVSFSTGQNVVQLQVTDNNQCSNTASILVTVSSPTLSVSFSPTICVNNTLMATINTNMSSTNWFFPGSGSPTNFTNTPNTPTLLPIVPFSSGGLKNFTVSIVPGGTCQPVVQTYTVFVEEVIANFARFPLQSPHTTCQPSLVATYTNLSTTNSGASLSFTWNATWPPLNVHTVVPNQVVTTNTNQLATFTLYQGNANPYNYYQNFLNPNIFLVAKSNSSAGCAVTTWTTNLDTVIRTSAWFYTNKKEGCSPLVVTFKDTSLTFNPFFPITSYTWCNGASPPVFVPGTIPAPPSAGSVIPLQTFTYSTPGTYSAYLIVKTQNGCLDTSFLHPIVVSNTPSISGFTVSPNPACAGNTSVQINMSVTPSNSLINHWHVTTDNQFFSGCINDPNPSFPFTHTGIHTFTVTAYQNGCSASSAINQSITINGPYGKFRMETNCDINKKWVKFNVHLQSVQSATLNYGDNTNDIIVGNPTGSLASLLTHTYANSGDYTVTLISSKLSTGCANHSFSQVLKIRQPRARITYNNGQSFPPSPIALACTKSRYRFNAITSTENFTDCCSGFVWNLITPQYTLYPIEVPYPWFGLITYPSPPSPTSYPPVSLSFFDPFSLDTFRIAGTYTINLKVKDVNGCTDTTTRIFRISKAIPSFSFSANPLCLSDTLVINNGTQANQVNPDVITNYTWTLGDNPPTVITSTNSTFNPKHKYAFSFPPSQTFSIMCIAKNNVGCIDTVVKPLVVNNPFPNFTSSSPYACIPKGGVSTINFGAVSGFASYSLSFGQTPVQWQNTNNFINVSNNYAVPGTYNSTLIVTDAQGCKATQSLQIIAYGQPTAGIDFTDNSNGVYCNIATPTLVSTTSINVTPVNYYVWTIGANQSPNTSQFSINPIFSNFGVTTVSLTVSFTGACASTTSVPVYVFPEPKASIVLDKNKFCLGETIQVSIKDTANNGVSKWVWFFGDAVPQPTYAAGTIQANLTKTLSYNYVNFPTSGINGKTTIYLLTYATLPQCKTTSSVDIEVIRVQADFIQANNVYAHCLGLPDNFIDKTPNLTNLNYRYEWDFGLPPKLTGPNASYVFPTAGIFTVNLKVIETGNDCVGNSIKSMTIFPLPKVSIQMPDSACPSVPFSVVGSGTPGLNGTLKGLIATNSRQDSVKFNLQNNYNILDSALVSSTFSITAIDQNGCVSKPAIDSIYIQQKPNVINWDTTVIIGELIPINAFIDKNYTYTWSPLFTNLTCTNCYNPISSTTLSINYTVVVEDTPLNCFLTQHKFNIKVDPKTSIDVPSAFTPNGDGINDLIYVGGWGIRKLLYFKIYNRWGQLIFQTNDLKTGWNGQFEGVPQNMETYVYEVAVETYLDNTLSKSGTIKIIR